MVADGMTWVQRATSADSRQRPAASLPSLPLSIGGRDGIWPDDGYGNSDSNSDDGDSNDSDSDDGGCRGAALTELTHDDAVGSRDDDLWFSVATGRQDDNEGSDISSLTNATIPRDKDGEYDSGEEDEGKKTLGGEDKEEEEGGGGGGAPARPHCCQGQGRRGRCRQPRRPGRGAPRASRGAAGPRATAPGGTGTVIRMR